MILKFFQRQNSNDIEKKTEKKTSSLFQKEPIWKFWFFGVKRA